MVMRGSTCSGWHALAGLLLPLALANSGCGGGPATATVSGSVTYRGAALPVGKVSFYGPNGQVASALVVEDGTYEATNVPLGAVKVAVSTPPPPGPELEKAAKEGKRRFGKGNLMPSTVNTVSIPVKYSDAAKSGLALTVTEGSQPFNIELK